MAAPSRVALERMLRRAAARGINRGLPVLQKQMKAETPVGPRKNHFEDHAGRHPGALRRAYRRQRATAADLTGQISNDAPHAADQHEATHYEHPQGGKAHFMRDPLVASKLWYPTVVRQEVADEVDDWKAKH